MTRKLLTNLFEAYLQSVADDPVACLDGAYTEEIEEIVLVGKDLGVDVWGYWESNSSRFELGRLRLLEKNGVHDRDAVQKLFDGCSHSLRG